MRHFKVSPVLKIDETVYKEAESMCSKHFLNIQLKSYRKFHQLKAVLIISEVRQLNSSFLNCCIIVSAINPFSGVKFFCNLFFKFSLVVG